MLSLIAAASLAAPQLPPPSLQVHAWVQAGLSLHLAEEGAPKAQAAIELARVQVKVDGGLYGAMVQIDAADGLKLLDAVAIAHPLPWLTVKGGRFKVPVSADFMVPASKMLLPHRALLVEAVPHRELGIEADAELGDIGVLHLGVFDPVSALDVTGPGVRPVLAGAVTLPGGVDVRVAGTTWVRSARAQAEMDHTLAPEWDHELDVAIEWHLPASAFVVEGLLVHPTERGPAEGGVTAVAAHNVPLGEHLGLEIVGEWDTAYLHQTTEHRLIGGLNLHVDGWRFVTSLTWEADFDATLEHVTEGVGRVQVQAGF